MKHIKKAMAILLSFAMVVVSLAAFPGFVPHVHADYEDGMDCPVCGNYHWDDYLACD